MDVLDLHRLVTVTGEHFLLVTDATVALAIFDFQKRRAGW